MKQKVYQSLIELTNGKWSSLAIQRFAKSPGVAKLFHHIYVHTEYKWVRFHNLLRRFQHYMIFSFEKSMLSIVQLQKVKWIAGSPVDAKVESIGSITSNGTFLVKEKSYTLTDLLGNVELASKYIDGTYIVFYLSPADYHRIHSPVNGHVKQQVTLGEKSYPVNQAGLTYGKTPISGNYRQVTHLVCPNTKTCAVISVGAMLVNSIQMTNTIPRLEKGRRNRLFHIWFDCSFTV